MPVQLTEGSELPVPIAAEGVLHGRRIRKSLDLLSWEAAQKLVRDWEANPLSAAVMIREASEKLSVKWG